MQWYKILKFAIGRGRKLDIILKIMRNQGIINEEQYKQCKSKKSIESIPDLHQFAQEINRYIDLFEQYRERYRQITGIVKNIQQIQSFDELKNEVLTAIETINKAEKDKTNYSAPAQDGPEPVYSDNQIDLYRGDNPQACVAIRNKLDREINKVVPTTWCVSRTEASKNLFYTYRFNKLRSTFYFGLRKQAPNTDDYKIFALQITVNNKPILTSKNNTDQDSVESNWKEVFKIIPELKNAMNQLKYVPISPEDEQIIKRLQVLPDEQFKALPAKEQMLYIVIHNGLQDKLYCEAKEEVKNKYINDKLPINREKLKCSTKDQIKSIKRLSNITYEYAHFGPVKNTIKKFTEDPKYRAYFLQNYNEAEWFSLEAPEQSLLDNAELWDIIKQYANTTQFTSNDLIIRWLIE